MLVEAAWSISTQPGPLRAFFNRVKQRRGQQIAAVATARKLAVLIWHLLTNAEDYAWTRPALMQWKIRELELRAGRASRRGGNKPGPARDYSLKTVRDIRGLVGPEAFSLIMDGMSDAQIRSLMAKLDRHAASAKIADGTARRHVLALADGSVQPAGTRSRRPQPWQTKRWVMTRPPGSLTVTARWFQLP